MLAKRSRSTANMQTAAFEDVWLRRPFEAARSCWWPKNEQLSRSPLAGARGTCDRKRPPGPTFRVACELAASGDRHVIYTLPTVRNCKRSLNYKLVARLPITFGNLWVAAVLVHFANKPPDRPTDRPTVCIWIQAPLCFQVQNVLLCFYFLPSSASAPALITQNGTQTSDRFQLVCL